MNAPLLGRTNPGYRRECGHTRNGCTCFWFNGQAGAKAKRLRRRQARKREAAVVRRNFLGL
ncbi:hypothetical protein [Streptacidiphilus cavernicola]|uniref:Uncharacterized protein n=1 Tax=Streptacidiphilus cavernicola TaxID=3342716 RepID=A0ABV6VY66_9ACTN